MAIPLIPTLTVVLLTLASSALAQLGAPGGASTGAAPGQVISPGGDHPSSGAPGIVPVPREGADHPASRPRVVDEEPDTTDDLGTSRGSTADDLGTSDGSTFDDLGEE